MMGRRGAPLETPRTGTGAGGIRPSRLSAAAGDERGSGSVLAIGVLGAVVAFAVAVVPVGSLLVAHQMASAAADAAALAAADTASGRVPGISCDAASRTAEHNQARVTECTVDSLIATVSVAVPSPWGDVIVSARAGPPPP
ncbi:Rv3654c family TadE-like protein [Plantibacter sp. YIM 135249]|uniref:Rv3654c family TadE-like protein n=1 Tax=Plantibacter sp. YIM 135249 TaxID=3423918 RepID=UPI003D32A065